MKLPMRLKTQTITTTKRITKKNNEKKENILRKSLRTVRCFCNGICLNLEIGNEMPGMKVFYIGNV